MSQTKARKYRYGWHEKDAMISELTHVCREVDPLFVKEGGGTRHWVRDFFLQEMKKRGHRIILSKDRRKFWEKGE